jgi:hypothetical protein
LRDVSAMSAYFINPLTPPTGLGLLASPTAAGSSRSGSARLGCSQKDGLPSRSRALMRCRAQGHRLPHRGGAAWSLPLQIGRAAVVEWTGPRHNGDGLGKVGPSMNTPIKTVLVLLATVSAFSLGRYSVDFSGSAAAWTAVIASGVALVGSLFVLVRYFWKSNA